MSDLVERLRALAENATPGPWSCNNKAGYVFGPDCVTAECGDFRDKALVPFNGERWNADARLIAEMRTALPALLDRITELEGERDTATRALGEALEVRTWTEVERDGMAEAYRLASKKHGHYETLFAVGAWLLRHRAALSKTEGKG